MGHVWSKMKSPSPILAKFVSTVEATFEVSTVLAREIHILVTSVLSFENTFSLFTSKIVLFGKGLRPGDNFSNV